MSNFDATSDAAASRTVANGILVMVLTLIALGIAMVSINCFAVDTIYRWYKYIFWGGTALGALWLVLWLIRMRRIGRRLQPKQNILLLVIGPFGLGWAAFCLSAFLVDAAILVSSHRIVSFQTPVHVSPSAQKRCAKDIGFYDVNVGRSIDLCADSIVPGAHTDGYSVVTDAVGPLGAKVMNITVPTPVTPAITTHKSQSEDLNYAHQIQAAILLHLVFPPGPITGNPVAQIKVTTGANGEIVDAVLVKSSGSPSCDKSALDAVLKTGRIPPGINGQAPKIFIISIRFSKQ